MTHDADCIRRDDDKPTSLCSCGMSDHEVKGSMKLVPTAEIGKFTMHIDVHLRPRSED